MNKDDNFLPEILELLSSKIHLRETYDILVQDLKIRLGERCKDFANIEQNINQSLDIGINLGILAYTHSKVRLSMSLQHSYTRKQDSMESFLDFIEHANSDTDSGEFEMETLVSPMPSTSKAAPSLTENCNRACLMGHGMSALSIKNKTGSESNMSSETKVVSKKFCSGCLHRRQQQKGTPYKISAGMKRQKRKKRAQKPGKLNSLKCGRKMNPKLKH